MVGMQFAEAAFSGHQMARNTVVFAATWKVSGMAG
jgi:hypothetical protein